MFAFLLWLRFGFTDLAYGDIQSFRKGKHFQGVTNKMLKFVKQTVVIDCVQISRTKSMGEHLAKTVSRAKKLSTIIALLSSFLG